MTFRLTRIAAALAAFTLAPSLQAQDAAAPLLLAGHPYPPSETTLDTITITGQRTPSLTAPDAHEAQHALEHVPGGVELELRHGADSSR